MLFIKSIPEEEFKLKWSFYSCSKQRGRSQGGKAPFSFRFARSLYFQIGMIMDTAPQRLLVKCSSSKCCTLPSCTVDNVWLRSPRCQSPPGFSRLNLNCPRLWWGTKWFPEAWTPKRISEPSYRVCQFLLGLSEKNLASSNIYQFDVANFTLCIGTSLKEER